LEEHRFSAPLGVTLPTASTNRIGSETTVFAPQLLVGQAPLVRTPDGRHRRRRAIPRRGHARPFDWLVGSFVLWDFSDGPIWAW